MKDENLGEVRAVLVRDRTRAHGFVARWAGHCTVADSGGDENSDSKDDEGDSMDEGDGSRNNDDDDEGDEVRCSHYSYVDMARLVLIYSFISLKRYCLT